MPSLHTDGSKVQQHAILSGVYGQALYRHQKPEGLTFFSLSHEEAEKISQKSGLQATKSASGNALGSLRDTGGSSAVSLLTCTWMAWLGCLRLSSRTVLYSQTCSIVNGSSAAALHCMSLQRQVLTRMYQALPSRDPMSVLIGCQSGPKTLQTMFVLAIISLHSVSQHFVPQAFHFMAYCAWVCDHRAILSTFFS